MKVYVITKGSYSDYSIYGVALNKKHAEEMQKYFSDEYEEAEIEEYETEDYIPIHEGKTQYCVYFRNNGTVNCYRPWCVYEKVNNKILKDVNGAYKIYLWAEDEEHAKKIAFDKMAEYKYRKAIKE